MSELRIRNAGATSSSLGRLPTLPTLRGAGSGNAPMLVAGGFTAGGSSSYEAPANNEHLFTAPRIGTRFDSIPAYGTSTRGKSGGSFAVKSGQSTGKVELLQQDAGSGFNARFYVRLNNLGAPGQYLYLGDGDPRVAKKQAQTLLDSGQILPPELGLSAKGSNYKPYLVTGAITKTLAGEIDSATRALEAYSSIYARVEHTPERKKTLASKITAVVQKLEHANQAINAGLVSGNSAALYSARDSAYLQIAIELLRPSLEAIKGRNPGAAVAGAERALNTVMQLGDQSGVDVGSSAVGGMVRDLHQYIELAKKYPVITRANAMKVLDRMAGERTGEARVSEVLNLISPQSLATMVGFMGVQGVLDAKAPHWVGKLFALGMTAMQIKDVLETVAKLLSAVQSVERNVGSLSLSQLNEKSGEIAQLDASIKAQTGMGAVFLLLHLNGQRAANNKRPVDAKGTRYEPKPGTSAANVRSSEPGKGLRSLDPLGVFDSQRALIDAAGAGQQEALTLLDLVGQFNNKATLGKIGKNQWIRLIDEGTKRTTGWVFREGNVYRFHAADAAGRPAGRGISFTRGKSGVLDVGRSPSSHSNPPGTNTPNGSGGRASDALPTPKDLPLYNGQDVWVDQVRAGDPSATSLKNLINDFNNPANLNAFKSHEWTRLTDANDATVGWAHRDGDVYRFHLDEGGKPGGKGIAITRNVGNDGTLKLPEGTGTARPPEPEAPLSPSNGVGPQSPANQPAPLSAAQIKLARVNALRESLGIKDKGRLSERTMNELVKMLDQTATRGQITPSQAQSVFAQLPQSTQAFSVAKALVKAREALNGLTPAESKVMLEALYEKLGNTPVDQRLALVKSLMDYPAWQRFLADQRGGGSNPTTGGVLSGSGNPKRPNPNESAATATQEAPQGSTATRPTETQILVDPQTQPELIPATADSRLTPRATAGDNAPQSNLPSEVIEQLNQRFPGGWDASPNATGGGYSVRERSAPGGGSGKRLGSLNDNRELGGGRERWSFVEQRGAGGQKRDFAVDFDPNATPTPQQPVGPRDAAAELPRQTPAIGVPLEGKPGFRIHQTDSVPDVQVMALFDRAMPAHAESAKRGNRADQISDWHDADAVVVITDERGQVVAAGKGNMLVGNTATIDLMAVASEASGRGLGRETMRSLEAQLQKLGATKIELMPATNSPTAHSQLVDFYKKLGYTESTLNPGHMEKQLGAISPSATGSDASAVASGSRPSSAAATPTPAPAPTPTPTPTPTPAPANSVGGTTGDGLLPSTSINASPSALAAQPTPNKPALTRIGDVVGKGLNGVFGNDGLLDKAISLPTVFVDRAIRSVGGSGVAQGLKGNRMVRGVGGALNAVAGGYREAGRRLINNRLVTNGPVKYQAWVRQGRYDLQLNEALKLKEAEIRNGETGQAVFASLDAAVGQANAEAQSYRRQLTQQTATTAEARSAGNASVGNDARIAIQTTIIELEKIREKAAKAFEPLKKEIDKYITKGEKLLKTQSDLRAVRSNELRKAIAQASGVETPALLAARKKMAEADAPWAAAELVRTTREEVAAMSRDHGPDSGQAKDARAKYETAKHELERYVLSGKSRVIDVLIDRDDGLGAQLIALRAKRDELAPLVEQKSFAQFASKARAEGTDASAGAYAENTTTQLENSKSFSDGRVKRAAEKIRSSRTAELQVRGDAKIDQITVDAASAGSDLGSELGRIGYLHSMTKDLFDGKGKGRIDQLSNKANIDIATKSLDTVNTELAQWEAQRDQIYVSLAEHSQTGGPAQASDALNSQLEIVAKGLQSAKHRQTNAVERLVLEQRAAEPRSIKVRIDDIGAKVEESARLRDAAVSNHRNVQAKLRQEIAPLEREIAALNSTLANTTGQPMRLTKEIGWKTEHLEGLQMRLLANDSALMRANAIHAGTVGLQARAQDVYASAQQTAGLTPGKIPRNVLRMTSALAKGGIGSTLALLATGQIRPDTPAELSLLLKQINAAGSEAPLISAEAKGYGVTLLQTVQGPQLAWRVKGPVSDISVVVQYKPMGRGLFTSALFNGGKLGKVSPSLVKGSAGGGNFVVDSQRITLASVTLTSVFHSPGNTALNWTETAKLDFGNWGVTSRLNTASNNPRTGKNQAMAEIVGSGTIGAPLKVGKVPLSYRKLPFSLPLIGNILPTFPGMGLGVTLKSSLGVGQLSLGYNPNSGVGVSTDRTAPLGLKAPFTDKPIFENRLGTQPYGVFGTQVKLEKNYYAESDPRNEGHWLIRATDGPRQALEGVTGKSLIDWLIKQNSPPETPKKRPLPTPLPPQKIR